MKAFRLVAWKAPGEMREVPVPEPQHGQARIRIGGAGICQSDLHILADSGTRAPLSTWPVPMTLGHENAGWIDALGPATTGFEVGEAVLVGPSGCGFCKHCAEGRNNYCFHQDRHPHPGIGVDGGLADMMLSDVRGLIRLGSLPPWQAAPLADAGMTSYHAVKRILPQATPDTDILVIGVGGLGHMAISILKALCASRIIAVDRSDAALTLGRTLGADVVIKSDEHVAQAVREATHGRGVGIVLDFVGSTSTLALAASSVHMAASIVVIGLGGGHYDFNAFQLPWGCSISTVWGGSRADVWEVVALAQAGRIQPHIERHPLEHVQHALDRLARGEVVGRAVMTPAGQT